jgi:hypothetical protein
MVEPVYAINYEAEKTRRVCDKGVVLLVNAVRHKK